jgi:hypothetical protein
MLTHFGLIGRLSYVDRHGVGRIEVIVKNQN